MSARGAADDFGKKRRPPVGGLSLGRKRPKEGMCDVSHRSNIALQRSKGKRFFSTDVGACRSDQPDFPEGSGEAALLRRAAPELTPIGEKRRPPVGGLSLGRKRPRRACTTTAVRGLMWRKMQQLQDLNRTLG